MWLRTRCSLLLVLLTLASWAGLAQSAHALNPESPEVKKLTEKALKYLETVDHARLGGKCLIGLVFVKQGKDENHPQVQKGVDACVNLAKSAPENIKTPVYDLGIAVIFLCNLDPSKYNHEITTMLKALELLQKDHGGWGYNDKPTGDTSMTQYGALSAWEAVKVGFVMPRESVEKMADWIIRTQDPSGGWGYQGTPADTTGGRVKQDRTTNCLSTAALGCSYVAADLLGFATTTPKNDDPNLPPALIPIRNELPPAKDGDETVDPKLLKRAQSDGQRFFSEHHKFDIGRWTYYYIYALERYQSFREATTGQVQKDPGWYNSGVEFLRQNQEEDGSWLGKGNEDNRAVDTAFATLFLVRSMKKSIERAQAFGAGRMAGAQRLPTNLAAAEQRSSRLVLPWKESNAKLALQIVLDPNHQSFSSCVDNIDELATLFKTQKIDGSQSAQTVLVKSYEQAPLHSRILILRILGHMDELKHTTILIDALEDESLQVRREALDNLERLTKRFSPIGAGALNQPEQRAKLVEDWKSWYSSLSTPRTSAAAIPVTK